MMNVYRYFSQYLLSSVCLSIALYCLPVAPALADGTAPAANTAKAKDVLEEEIGAFFIEPKDGAVVSSPFKVKFGAKGIVVEPAGEQTPGKGHHHLIINGDGLPAGVIMPFDEKHLHFGKGQTETTLKLPPGNYKLTMQMADGYHLSYGRELSATIRVTVK